MRRKRSRRTTTVRIQLARVPTNIDDEFVMSRRHEPTATRRTTEQKDPSSQGPHNERARGARHENVASLVPACSGARVCHDQGREDSTGSADRSIKSSELVEPLTTRCLVKRLQRRLKESEVADVRRATELGLAKQVTSTAEQGQGVRTQWPGSPSKEGLRRERCPWGRQCLAQDSAGMSGLERKRSQAWDPRTQERKEHSQLQADRKQSAFRQSYRKEPQAFRFPRHRAPNKMVETPGATERKVPILQSSAQAPTAQTLKAWKLSSRSFIDEDIEIPVSAQRQPGFRRSWRFLSTLTRRSSSLLRAQKTASMPQVQSNEKRVDDTVIVQTCFSSPSSTANSEDASDLQGLPPK